MCSWTGFLARFRGGERVKEVFCCLIRISALRQRMTINNPELLIPIVYLPKSP